MSDFKVKSGIGSYVVLEPHNKSTVLNTVETETVFKVVALGAEVKEVKQGILVAVTPGAVEKTMMGRKEIYYVQGTDIVAEVEEHL